MNSTTIVYVDDEEQKISEYLEYLQELGFDVAFFRDVDSAWDYLVERQEPPAAVVLDSMMPPGGRYREGPSDSGLLTGILFYREVREGYGGGLPVYILTNNTDPAIQEAIEDDPMAEVILKTEVLFDEFGEIVKSGLAGRRRHDHVDPTGT